MITVYPFQKTFTFASLIILASLTMATNVWAMGSEGEFGEDDFGNSSSYVPIQPDDEMEVDENKEDKKNPIFSEEFVRLGAQNVGTKCRADPKKSESPKEPKEIQEVNKIFLETMEAYKSGSNDFWRLASKAFITNTEKLEEKKKKYEDLKKTFLGEMKFVSMNEYIPL